MKLIKDFVDRDDIHGQLLVVSSNQGTTDKGKTYLNITFQDKSGTIEAKKLYVFISDIPLFSLNSSRFILESNI